jgi:phosphoenolpyruvate carboxylase
MWRCNDELRVRAAELHRSSKKDEVAKHYIGGYHTLSSNSGDKCCTLSFKNL